MANPQTDFERLAEAAHGALLIDRLVPVTQAARHTLPAGQARLHSTGGAGADFVVQLAERPRMRVRLVGTLEMA